MIADLYRPADALLAGVCAELARRLGWNVWALRVLFVAGLLVKTIATGAVYLVAALIMGLAMRDSEEVRNAPGGLASDRLRERGERIRNLEEKFKDLEQERR